MTEPSAVDGGLLTISTTASLSFHVISDQLRDEVRRCGMEQGALVASCLHTTTAPQAIVRLLEIGVEPFMVAPSVIGVLSQRLAARICDACKEAYYPSRETLQRYFQDEGLTDVPFFRGRGCPACRHTGYNGRLGLFELLVADEEVRRLASERASTHLVQQAAIKGGMKNLRENGWRKACRGVTTIDEVLRVTKSD